MFFVISEVQPFEPDYYVGLPNKALLAHFDGFQEVSEAHLPKEVSKIVFSGGGSSKEEPFASRFKFKYSDKWLLDDDYSPATQKRKK